MNDAVMRRPKFDLRFITETSEYHIVSDAKKPNNNFMTESIISMSTKNAMEDDSSVFSFVIAGDMEWDKILNENDMVILKIEPNESTPGSPGTKDNVSNNTVAIGLVSEVRLEAMYSDNSRMYRITGQSLAKAFMQFELRAIQGMTFENPMMGWMDGKGDLAGFSLDLGGKSVAYLVNTMMNRFLDSMVYYFNKSDSTNNKLQSRIATNIKSWEDDEMLLNPVSFTNFEGSFNQLLKEIVQKPFCEMFFDVYSDTEDNEKALFVVRRTPFDKEDWDALPQFQLGSRDVISEQLARTDLDAYSIFNVKPDNFEETDYPIFEITPQFHPSLVEKYGYKMLEITHKYLTPFSSDATVDSDSIPGVGNLPIEEDNATGSATSLTKKYSKKLYDWYVMNPNFYAGEIRVTGHPDYRMGNRLIYSDVSNNDVWEFYIESVEHDFSYANGYTTSLGVTRGLRISESNQDGGRFNPPTGAPQDFRGGYLGELSLDDIKKEREKQANVNKGKPGLNGNAGAGHGLIEGDPNDKAVIATDFALQFVNNSMGDTAYHWGGGRQSTNPLTGNPPYLLDCSSFVYWAYKYAGVQLGGSDTGMTTWTIGGNENGSLWKVGGIGSGIKATNLTYGDIVFFNNDEHVGIYVGGGDFVGWNGSGYNNYAKGCEKRSMVDGYWAGKFEGHVMRY